MFYFKTQVETIHWYGSSAARGNYVWGVGVNVLFPTQVETIHRHGGSAARWNYVWRVWVGYSKGNIYLLAVLPHWRSIVRIILLNILLIDRNNCRQPTLKLHGLLLEVLTVHGNELLLFWAVVFLLLILLILRKWHCSSAVGTILKSLAIMRLGSIIEPITYQTPVADALRVMPQIYRYDQIKNFLGLRVV